MTQLRRIAVAALVLIASAAAYLGVQYLAGNVHEVIAGQFYRSGQLSSARLADVIERHGIKTVLNLRGESQRPWYRQEVATTERLGARHVDFRMSAARHMSVAEIEQLVTVMREAPKPLLVHCEGGADRTGLAAVLYLQQIAGVHEDVAELQLSPLFGHIGIASLFAAHAMDESWENFEAARDIEAEEPLLAWR
jgi:protein tyrosine/serine phosphatase